VLAAYEAAQRDAERRRNQRQHTLIDGLTRFKAVNGGCVDLGRLREFVGAIATRDAKAEDARR
jgi:hypothetical protein